MKRIVLLLFFPLTVACQASAQPASPGFVLPVACEIGVTCLVQKLVDHDPGPGRQDYRCGLLTTDGHDGVDIRLRTMADMKSGYAVIASAAGQITRIRDGEPDISSHIRTSREGKDAGNGVVIDHADGWQTQYSHLRQGSITVKPGQRIAAGARIGLIGMSGNAEFPHLHFTVRYQGKAIDPFIGAKPIEQCNPTQSTPGVWAPATARTLDYVPTVVITAGLASNVPPRSVADRTAPSVLDGPLKPVLMWVDVIGARSGDTQEFRIIGPDGRLMHVQKTNIEGGGLSWFAYSGKRAPVTGWPPGRYVGEYKLSRDSTIVAQIETSGAIR